MKLNIYFKLKPDSMYPPDEYLDTKIKQIFLPNGALTWGQSNLHYVRNAVKKLEEWMVKEGRTFPKKAPTPLSSTYKPEADVSPELSLEMATFYPSQVGVLRLIIKIARQVIITEMSMMAAHMTIPREGHLNAVIHVFACLKN
jgi:hypothetical protein